MMRRILLPALVLLAPAAGCGGADEGRPSYDPVHEFEAIDQCQVAEAYEFLPMLDFEPHMTGGDVSLNARCDPQFLSSCSFYFNYDVDSSPPNPSSGLDKGDDCIERAVRKDAEVSTSPRLGAQSISGEEIDAERCGGTGSALHIVTENVGMCYGSDGRLGWGAALDVTFSPPLDASEWDGISLWVRQGEAGEKPAFILQFVDPMTIGTLDEDDEPLYCEARDARSDGRPIFDFEKCDSFGTAITLPDDWGFVPIRFDTLQQKGFGELSELGYLQVDEINRMQILIDAGDADFWIDDISLFREAD